MQNSDCFDQRNGGRGRGGWRGGGRDEKVFIVMITGINWTFQHISHQKNIFLLYGIDTHEPNPFVIEIV